MFLHRSLIKAAVLSAETKNTEPSKRSFTYKLPVCGVTSEISVILVLLAVFSPPTIYYIFITSLATKNPPKKISILKFNAFYLPFAFQLNFSFYILQFNPERNIILQMETRVIQLTPAAHKHGNLNIRPCGREFFPSDVFGGPSKKAGLGVPITLKADGLPTPIETDIPKDKAGKPRWIFRKRKWVKDFVRYHKLYASDTVTIKRISKRTYNISPNNNSTRATLKETSDMLYHSTKLGKIYIGDSLKILEKLVKPASVDLIMTSPPFGLVRKKNYGNVSADRYVEWFKPFGRLFHQLLKRTGSFVVDIGGSWNPGLPTRSLYIYELLIALCKDCGFHLAQEFFWWNPSKLPTPAEWVTVRRIRVKDAINFVWWLSKTPWPKASNRRVLIPYSGAMHSLLKNGYKAKLRPSGHDINGFFCLGDHNMTSVAA